MQIHRVLLTGVAALLSVSLFTTTQAFPAGFVLPSAAETPSSDRSLRMAPQLPATALSSLSTNADHSYVRPQGADVSGFPKNKAPYHRSPCPCLNSLANHGYLPRDGKNLTPEMIKQAIMDVFHLDESISQMLVNNLPASLTLADLGVHNFIEHDASMVHDDSYFGQDPSQVNATLVEELLARANKKGQLTIKAVAHWRHDREVTCQKTNPQFDFGLKRQTTAYAEAAAFLLAMGQYDSQSISVEHAQSFLLNERIPDDFERSKVPITGAKALYVAAKIKAMATFPWELLSAY